MNQSEKDTLAAEDASGRRAQKAYNEFIKPFIEAKEKLLYEAFKDADPEHSELLCNIARASLAIRALDAEINSHILTGQMASISLAQEEDNATD